MRHSRELHGHCCVGSERIQGIEGKWLITKTISPPCSGTPWSFLFVMSHEGEEGGLNY